MKKIISIFIVLATLISCNNKIDYYDILYSYETLGLFNRIDAIEARSQGYFIKNIDGCRVFVFEKNNDFFIKNISPIQDSIPVNIIHYNNSKIGISYKDIIKIISLFKENDIESFSYNPDNKRAFFCAKEFSLVYSEENIQLKHHMHIDGTKYWYIENNN
ncbi:MAG: hypothetical protein H6Q15_699 [Bacteroidetes bacterium]|nr:hypothetical protein [Bacteroidota bacterium]